MAVGKISTTALVVFLLASVEWALGTEETTLNGYRIPPLLSPWDAYPNVLNITNEDRRRYHPVLKFPKIWVDEEEEEEASDMSSDGQKKRRRRRRRRRVDNYSIMDLRNLSKEDGLATPEEWLQSLKQGRRVLVGQKEESDNVVVAAAVGYKMDGYSVGRYDENRAHLYGSEMFEDGSHRIDGYSGEDRTIHMGIDLQGPLGTKIHAFWSGRVYKAGYNPDLGDYGNVIVLEHDLGKGRTVWALYGHLDNQSVQKLKEGQRIRRGQALGCVGDLHENGGWYSPHVHFQLSVHPPETHDMPGVVSPKDRDRALLNYPDPRLVLGPLY